MEPLENREEVERKEALVESRCDFGSGKGRVRVEDSEDAYGGLVGAVAEGADEGEEEGGDRVFGEREEKLLGEGE